MKGYKTIVFNVVMALVVLISAFVSDSVLPTGDDVQSAIKTIEMIVMAVGNIWLRFKTNTPIFRSR